MFDSDSQLKSPEFWSKNMVQIISAAAAAYAIYSGNKLSPEEQAMLIKGGFYVLGAAEAAYHVARGLKKGD